MVIQAQAVFVGSYPKGSIGIFLDNVNIFYLSPSCLQSYALETVGALVIQKQPVQIGSQPNAAAAILKNRQHHSGRQFVRGIVAIHFTVGVQPVYPVAIGSYPHPARRVLENAQHTLRPDIQLGVEEVQSPVMKIRSCWGTIRIPFWYSTSHKLSCRSSSIPCTLAWCMSMLVKSESYVLTSRVR